MGEQQHMHKLANIPMHTNLSIYTHKQNFTSNTTKTKNKPH